MSSETIVDAVENIVNVFIEHRNSEEKFTDVFKRVGIEPFKEKVYG